MDLGILEINKKFKYEDHPLFVLVASTDGIL